MPVQEVILQLSDVSIVRETIGQNLYSAPDAKQTTSQRMYTVPGPSSALEAGCHMHNIITHSLEPALAPQAQVAPNCFETMTCAGTHVIPSAYSAPTWRCSHGNIVVPAAAPETLAAGENACGLCVRWPTVVHAQAYAVEILNQNTMVSQRYLHAMPEGSLPFVMDMWMHNLQPGAYAACVRCIAPCGCESTCSPWSCAQLGLAAPMASAPAPAMLLLPPNPPSHIPQTCPPPPSAPPSLPLTKIPGASTLPTISEESLGAAGLAEDEILTLD